MAVDPRNRDELMDLGAGKAASDEIVALYRQAFRAYGIRTLWSWREIDRPTLCQVLRIAQVLRTEGDGAARTLAARIEEACRAAL